MAKKSKEKKKPARQPAKKRPGKGAVGGEDFLAPLTMNERKWLAGYVETGNGTAAAMKVRRFDTKQHAAMAAWRWKKSIAEKIDIDMVMESVGLSDVALFRRLVEGIDATSEKVFQYEGKIIKSKPMIDWTARAKHLELAAKMKGLLTDRVKHGLDDELEKKAKEGVVVLPALAFGPSKGNGHGNGEAANEPGDGEDPG